MYLSVIIPAYNEGRRLGRTLEEVRSYLARQNFDAEVIVVNDGSSDDTEKVVTTLARDWPVLRVISYQPNRGKGQAVKEGMLAARGDYRLFMDADGSTALSEWDKLAPAFTRGAAVVIGSRRVRGAQITKPQPWYREFSGVLFRLLVRIVVPVGVIDSQNGFKAFSAPAAVAIFSRQTIKRWAFDVELLAIARRLRLQIAEVAIIWANDDESKITFLGMWRMLGEVLLIRWNLWRGRYGRLEKVA